MAALSVASALAGLFFLFTAWRNQLWPNWFKPHAIGFGVTMCVLAIGFGVAGIWLSSAS